MSECVMITETLFLLSLSLLYDCNHHCKSLSLLWVRCIVIAVGDCNHHRKLSSWSLLYHQHGCIKNRQLYRDIQCAAIIVQHGVLMWMRYICSGWLACDVKCHHGLQTFAGSNALPIYWMFETPNDVACTILATFYSCCMGIAITIANHRHGCGCVEWLCR